MQDLPSEGGAAAAEAPLGKSAPSSGAGVAASTARPGRRRTALRENVESLVVAGLLALLVRQFAMEAFVIPTGSMAATLLGAHVDVTCPVCDLTTPYTASLFERAPSLAAFVAEGRCAACGESARATIAGDEAPSSGSLRAPCAKCGASVELAVRPTPHGEAPAAALVTCPGCGHATPVRKSPKLWPVGDVSRGDRILVNKLAYEVAAPRRYDVIVFKFPQNPNENYIKRLIGLPGETVDIRDGDIVIDGKVARKPLDVQDGVWRRVHDLARIEKAGIGTQPPAWPTDGTGWRLEAGPTLACEAAPGPPIFLSYGRPITDETVYNVVSYYADDEGGRPTRRPRHVKDVRVSLRAELAAGASLVVRLRREPSDLALTVTATPPRAALRFRGEVVHEADAAVSPGAPFEVELFRSDGRAVLRLAGGARTVIDLPGEEQPAATPSGPGPESRVELGASGAAVRVRDVRIDRDLHHLALQPSFERDGTRFPFRVPEGRYFCLGDNASSSKDGRSWGTVPAGHVVGRAFLVFWPLLPGDLAVRRIR